MASSEFGMSERNLALVRKFQGNGWAVTCSPTSQGALSAIIGLEASVVKEPTEAPDSPEPRFTRYQPDWADAVLERSLGWQSDNAMAPLWVIKATEGWEFALFQLPAPDRRWIVKFAGRILEPFSHRFLGWADLHEIISHGFLLDHSMLIDGQSPLADLRRRKVNLLRSAELTGEHKSENQETDVRCNVSGTKLHGLETQTREGEIGPDRWRSCAEDFNRLLQKRLDRVFQAIGRKDHVAAATMKKAAHFVSGHWSFSDSALWMTTLKEIPYDAKMALKGKNWEIDFPDSNELLTVPDSAGMRAIARVLMCNNIPCPCALAADGSLLTEFLGRPRHHKYFEATYRRPRVECGDPANSEVERAICTAMHFKPGWYYRADHVISENSELHTVCGLPRGRVTLRRADALEGVRELIKRQQARLFFCSAPSDQFKRILGDIEAGIEFARKQENLLEQVQPKSEEDQERIQKAIYRAKKELETMGENWMTRYDRLADHFSESIKGGLVLQYTGPYRWKIEGLPQTPDTLDLAEDHKAFKRAKVAKAIRKAKAKIRARRSLNQLSRTAACGKA